MSVTENTGGTTGGKSRAERTWNPLRIFTQHTRDQSIPGVMLENTLSLLIGAIAWFNPSGYSLWHWLKSYSAKQSNGCPFDYMFAANEWSVMMWFIILLFSAVGSYLAVHIWLALRTVGIAERILIGVVLVAGYGLLGRLNLFDFANPVHVQWVMITAAVLVVSGSLTYAVYRRRRGGMFGTEDPDTHHG